MTEPSFKWLIVSLMSMTSNSFETPSLNDHHSDKPFDRNSISKQYNIDGMVLPRSKHDCVTMILTRRVYPTFIKEGNRCKSAELYKITFLETLIQGAGVPCDRRPGLGCYTILPSCPATSVKFPSAQVELGRQWNTQNPSQQNPVYKHMGRPVIKIISSDLDHWNDQDKIREAPILVHIIWIKSKLISLKVSCKDV